jgi:hypothetical protein
LPIPHWLLAHAAVACGYGPHAWPHAPQFFTSFVSLTHNVEQHDVPLSHAPPGPQCATHL